VPKWRYQPIKRPHTSGIVVPPEWFEMAAVLRLRLGQIEAAPEQAAWLTRRLVQADTRRVVGVAGFHGPPGGAWLRDVAPGGVELGYTVFPAARRRGYAAEAVEALVRWARDRHGVRDFVLSIAPANEPSARLAAKLGFARAGEWTHPERGVERVWRRTEP